MATSKTAARLLCAISLVALSTAFASGGCAKSPVNAICGAVCDCETCTDEQLQSCEDNGVLAQGKAQTLKCGTQFDTWAMCAQEKIGCKGGVTLGAACAGFTDKLNACTMGVVPFVAPCSLSNDHLRTCGVTPKGMKTSGCTPLFMCQATCVNAATCDELVDGFSGAPTIVSSKFLACYGKCSNGG